MKMSSNLFLHGNDFAAKTEKENLSEFFLNWNEFAAKTEIDNVLE